MTGRRDVGEPELEHSVTRVQRHWLLKLRAYMIRQICPAPFLLQPDMPLQKETEGTVSPDNATVNPMFFQRTLLSPLLFSLLNWVLGEKDIQAALPCMLPGSMTGIEQARPPSGSSALPISLSITSMSWSCFREDQEETLAHTAFPSAPERSVKSTGSLAEVFFSPGSSHCEQGTENQPNGNQFCFSLPEMEKGRSGSIPGLSTAFLTIDKSRS